MPGLLLFGRSYHIEPPLTGLVEVARTLWQALTTARIASSGYTMSNGDSRIARGWGSCQMRREHYYGVRY